MLLLLPVAEDRKAPARVTEKWFPPSPCRCASVVVVVDGSRRASRAWYNTRFSSCFMLLMGGVGGPSPVFFFCSHTSNDSLFTTSFLGALFSVQLNRVLCCPSHNTARHTASSMSSAGCTLAKRKQAASCGWFTGFIMVICFVPLLLTLASFLWPQRAEKHKTEQSEV